MDCMLIHEPIMDKKKGRIPRTSGFYSLGHMSLIREVDIGLSFLGKEEKGEWAMDNVKSLWLIKGYDTIPICSVLMY